MRKFLSALYKFAGTWTGTIIIVLFLIFFVAQSFVIPSGSMKRTLLIGDFLFGKKFSYGTPLPQVPWLNWIIFPDIWDNGHIFEGDRPERGDIVIFKPPHKPKTYFVKRCVAVGGDEVIYSDKKLLIHFNEGDAYIEKSYPAAKIVKLLGKLWVENPYKDQFPGINYTPGIYGTSFQGLIKNYPYIEMKSILIEELDSDVYYKNNTYLNAFYVKIEPDHFYMMGDNRDNSNDSRFWGQVPYKDIVAKPWVIYFSIEFRSYDTVLDEADQSSLKRACGDTDLNSNECKELWDKERFRIRWSRIGRNIDTLQYEEPSL
jgi:signal peptidase I